MSIFINKFFVFYKQGQTGKQKYKISSSFWAPTNNQNDISDFEQASMDVIHVKDWKMTKIACFILERSIFSDQTCFAISFLIDRVFCLTLVGTT